MYVAIAIKFLVHIMLKVFRIFTIALMCVDKLYSVIVLHLHNSIVDFVSCQVLYSRILSQRTMLTKLNV